MNLATIKGSRTTRVVLATIAAIASVIAAVSLAPKAEAARDLDVGFADFLYGSIDQSERDQWLDRTDALGAGIIRVNLYWNSVATRKPDNARNPGDPAYQWNTIDNAIRGAEERGMEVLLTVFRAPAYAEGPNRPSESVAPVGSWDPDPQQYGDFAHAVAERYSGRFSGLPAVDYFQAWNEPNLSTYITPQWKGKKNESSEIYQRLLNEFYDEVKAVNPGAEIVTAGTAPYGDPPGGPKRTQPLRFFQEMLCLNTKSKKGKCPAAGKPKADIFAHHPINREDPPRKKASNKGDIEIADFASLTKAVRNAEKFKTIATRGKHEIWADEVWWQTNPPDRQEGVSLKTHARWTAEGLYLLWKQGASKVIFLQFRDAKYTPGESSLASYQTGVYTFEGKKKPSADAAKFPFVTERKNKSTLRAWGIAPRSGKVTISAKTGKGGFKKVATKKAKEGRVFTANIRSKGSAKLRAKVGGETSLVWTQKKKNK